MTEGRASETGESLVPVTIQFRLRDLETILSDLGEPLGGLPSYLRSEDGGTTATHGTSCDGGTCQIDR
jgi:hypothetical protein